MTSSRKQEDVMHRMPIWEKVQINTLCNKHCWINTVIILHMQEVEDTQCSIKKATFSSTNSYIFLVVTEKMFPDSTSVGSSSKTSKYISPQCMNLMRKYLAVSLWPNVHIEKHLSMLVVSITNSHIGINTEVQKKHSDPGSMQAIRNWLINKPTVVSVTQEIELFREC